MGPHNLIQAHSAAQAFGYYAAGFSVGASVAVILVVIDRLNNGGK